jgi:hypothetical protein
VQHQEEYKTKWRQIKTTNIGFYFTVLNLKTDKPVIIFFPFYLLQVTNTLYNIMSIVVSSKPRHERVQTHNFSGDRH